MATKTVSLPDIGDITLYKKRGNRSLRLSIGPNGHVRVSLPYWLPYSAGTDFAIAKADWIAANRTRTETPILQHGHLVGKAHRLYFEATPASRKLSTRLDGNAIRISHPHPSQFHDDQVQQAAHRASLRALRKEAQALLPQRLQTLATQHGFSYRSVGVKPLKSRWGSCTSDQAITFNIFLMQLPWHLIDYVILHELTHTRIMQHGAPFWAELEKHLPQAKALRKQMADYHPVLQLRTPEAAI
jgi:predicted metal-dependent hydrolase